MDMTMFTDSLLKELLETAVTAIPFAIFVIAVHVLRRPYNRLVLLKLTT